MSAVTPSRAALHDLIVTMQAIVDLQERGRKLFAETGRDLPDADDQRLSKLEERREALEAQLVREVQEKLGIDYAVLWHAVTPSGPIPRLPG